MKNDSRIKAFTLHESFGLFTQSSKYQRMTPLDKSKAGRTSGFTLIELLVVISIIALLSSVVTAALVKTRVKARDSARVQNARQLAIALEQYEQSNNTYKIPNTGLNNEGGGYVSKGDETPGYTNSIVSALKSGGYYNSSKLIDPVYGTDNYYVGVCTSTNAFNVFIKLEQTDLAQGTSTMNNACGGTEAAALGFNYIAPTVGGTSGGQLAGGIGGASEVGSGLVGQVYASGIIDTSFIPLSGANGNILTTYIQPDGKILIGGNFTAYDGVSKNTIVRINSDGTIDNTFNPTGTGANNTVYAINIQPDGKILIGGDFTSYNGYTIYRLARLNHNGSLDTSFNIGGMGPTNRIKSIKVLSDGKIIIAGFFPTYNSTSRKGVAKLNADGTLDTSFDPGLGADSVYSMDVQTDGKIIIGGDFFSYNGLTKYRIARINTDGSLDTSFVTGGGPNGSVENIKILSDGKILIAGGFQLYNYMTRNYIAKLNINGSLDNSFNPGIGPNGSVFSSAIQQDDKIIIGGNFTTIDSNPTAYLARLNSDGIVDVSFNQSPGVNAKIISINIQTDGKIIAGGYFTMYSLSAANHILRIK